VQQLMLSSVRLSLSLSLSLFLCARARASVFASAQQALGAGAVMDKDIQEALLE